MRIAHISDLHFGAHDPHVAGCLVRALNEAQPDLVLVSGDITQHATPEEFSAAHDFFSGLPAPVFVIPGNHDLPGIDLRRFFAPWKRYRDHIGADLNPALRGACVDVKGINSARMILPASNWAYGSVSARQRREIADFFTGSGTRWRVLTLHHPPVSPSEFPLDVTVFNSDKLLRTIEAARIDIVLSGHQHHACVETRVMAGHTCLFICASTAMSLRIRKQPQGFNLLTFDEASVRIDLRQFAQDRFVTVSAITHTRL